MMVQLLLPVLKLSVLEVEVCVCVALVFVTPNYLQTLVHCTFCIDCFASTTAHNLNFYTSLLFQCLLKNFALEIHFLLRKDWYFKMLKD